MFRARGKLGKRVRAQFVLFCAAAVVVQTAAIAHALDTTPPTVTITPSGVLTAAQKVAFNEDLMGVNAGNVVLQLKDDGSVTVPASLRCKNASGAVVSCSGMTTRTVEMTPSPALIAGQSYRIAVNPNGSTPITDTSANPAPGASRPFLASVTEEESSAGATYVWGSFPDSHAIGGNYRAERSAGAVATYRFTGTSATWFTKLGPDQGTATIVLDGRTLGDVNNYRSAVQYQVARTWRGLASGVHTLKVVVRGIKGSSAATGAWIAADAFRTGLGPYQDATTYGWRSVASSGAYGGRYALSSATRAQVTFTFRGGGVDWFTVTGPYEGKALVYVDGKPSKTFDNYSAATTYRVRRTVAGLSDTVHTVTIAVTGTKSAASRGTSVVVDRWVLKASPGVFRKLGAWMDLFDYNASTSDTTIQGYIDDMKARGVRTLYLQTGRWNTDAIAYPAQVAQLVQRAHGAGMAIVGWYLPAYSEYLASDVTKTAAIAGFAAGNQRFDGLAIDIEYRVKTDSKTEFFNGISSHLAQVRSRVGLVFPVGAITFSPQDMDRWHAGWDGFPWSSVAFYANAALPMSYWSVSSNRSLCSGGNANYCPYGFTKQNVLRTRAYTSLPVHPIGGVANAITDAEVSAYVQAAKDTAAYGGGLYDYTTQSAHPSYWTPLAGLNAL
jgi:hypothetical protein